MVKQKHLTALADIGNKAAHVEWTKYNDADARAMVQGVEAIVDDLLRGLLEREFAEVGAVKNLIAAREILRNPS